MQDANTEADTDLIATLNDLLELDHDAVNAYSIAIEALDRSGWRQDLTRFRGDHERHIEELTGLIHAHGGQPADHSHMPTGAFKAAVQTAGAAGGDREVLLAFKSNEGQVRDKYRRQAEGDYPEDVEVVLRRNARDEERHYAWVLAALEQLGAGPESRLGRAERAFENVHGGTASVVEGMERSARSSRRAGLLVAGGVALAAFTLTRLMR